MPLICRGHRLTKIDDLLGISKAEEDSETIG